MLALAIDEDFSGKIHVSCTIAPSDYSDPSRVKIGDPIGELEKEFKDSFEENMRQFHSILQQEWDPDSKDPHMIALMEQHKNISTMVSFAKDEIERARRNAREFESFYLEKSDQCQPMLETLEQFILSMKKAKDKYTLLYGTGEKKKKYRN